MSTPTIRRISEHGHVAVDWPVPLQDTYPVAHEVIYEWASQLNGIADLRARLHLTQSITCTEALRLLDGGTS